MKLLPAEKIESIIFKEVLGFFMVATALWLVWVFCGQTGETATFIMLAGLFILTLACWVWGKWGTPFVKRPIRIAATVATLTIAASGFYLIVDAAYSEPEQSELVAMADIDFSGHNIQQWIPYSPERVDALRAQGKPIFVDFTAKWCLSCQTNHKVLESQKVRDKMAELGVVKLIGDWTKSDPVITKTLREYGRSGVPLYLLFGPDGQPEVLPQFLTPDVVLEYLENIEGKQDSAHAP